MHFFRMLVVLVTLLASTSFAAAPAAAATAPVDINAASVEQLEALDGIGAAKARAIVEFRDANGPFASVDDLVKVRGIGDKLLAALRPQVSVGSAPGGAAPAPKAR